VWTGYYAFFEQHRPNKKHKKNKKKKNKNKTSMVTLDQFLIQCKKNNTKVL